MGILSLFKGKGKIQNHYNNIPENILKLLWFKNGPYVNFPTRQLPKKEYIKMNNIDDFVKRITEEFLQNLLNSLTAAEPSLIDISSPVALPKSDVPKMGYYPSYSGMTPEQRYTYLSWLTDITQPIDIGYVFVFYYGLERHLLAGDHESAFQTVVALQKHHNNSSFLAYSSGGLLVCILKNQRRDLFQYLNLEHINGKLLVFVLIAIFRNLTAKDIMNTHKHFGFTNNRYIKSYPDIFENELKKIIAESCDQEMYPIVQDDLRDIKGTFSVMLVNFSLDSDERIFKLPDITTSEKLATEVHSFLKQSHDRTKAKLAAMRKNDKR